MMERSFSEALKQRRTYYSITNQSPISDQEIECIVNMTVRHVPSACLPCAYPVCGSMTCR